MAERVYEYRQARQLADGTIKVYTTVIRYTPTGRKRILSNAEIDDIRRKINEGVTKKRICNDYNICFNRLQGIIA